MSAQFTPWSAAVRQRPIVRRYFLPAALVAVALWLQGCTAVPPQPFVEADASDPNQRVPVASYRSAIAGYSSQKPVDPSPWVEGNRQVAPPEKGGQ